MRVCAVICEYNPFHLGHAYHLRAAREASGADYVLCLMSGALTQRGAFARHDKWLRARAAIWKRRGCRARTAGPLRLCPAPDFAGGGVALLAALGVVTHLSFGCEPSALPCFPPPHRFSNRNLPIFLPPCSGA
ncbi:MAG: nucleotidyltransferase family protein [Christensenellales bacterium]